jgi:serine phosphatase RsbU (regulator of sigma subunit)
MPLLMLKILRPERKEWIWRYRKDLIILFLLLVWVLVAYFAIPSWKAPLHDQRINYITVAGGEVWLGTERGAYRVEKGQAIPVLEGQRALAIAEVRGEVWIRTNRGAYRVERGQASAILEAPELWGVVGAGGEVWLGTERGAYRVEKGQAIPVLEGQRVFTIAEVRGEVWIGTSRGAYRVENGQASLVLDISGVVNISDVRGEFWLGTARGAYRVERGQAIPVLEELEVSTITGAGGEVWLSTERGAYRVERGQAIPVLEGEKVMTLGGLRDEVWIGTSKGAYRVQKGQPIQVLEAKGVWSIAEIRGEVWITADFGIYRVQRNQVIPVFEGSEVTAMNSIGGGIWFGTERGAYQVNGEALSPILNRPWITLAQEWFRYLPLLLFAVFTVVRGFQEGTNWIKHVLQQKEIRYNEGRLEREVEEARKLVAGLLPQEKPFERDDIYVAHARKQATTVSGDFYNFVSRGDGTLGIYFVDVEGHGLSASNQARSLYQAVTDGRWGHGDARRELEAADKLVREGAIFQKEDIALCMNFTEIDPVKMEIHHANAGMPSPLLFRWGEAHPQTLRAAGIYVGAGYGQYPAKPERVDVQVGPGDILVLSSDGIYEARDSRGRTFGQNGVSAAVYRTRHQSPQEIADEIIQSVMKHTQLENPEDDLTLVVVGIGQGVMETRLTSLKTLEEKEGVFRLMNAGDTAISCHNELREHLKTWAQKQEFDEKRILQIWSATWEAIQNAVKYGSKPWDVIQIQFILPSEDGRLGIEIKQPLLWEDWEQSLGARKKKQLQSNQVLMGGTIIMLWLANEIRVTELGRSITMWFSPELVSERKVSA